LEGELYVSTNLAPASRPAPGRRLPMGRRGEVAMEVARVGFITTTIYGVIDRIVKGTTIDNSDE
jgi:hypothetical protein